MIQELTGGQGWSLGMFLGRFCDAALNACFSTVVAGSPLPATEEGTAAGQATAEGMGLPAATGRPKKLQRKRANKICERQALGPGRAGATVEGKYLIGSLIVNLIDYAHD